MARNSNGGTYDIGPVLEFLRCRSPSAWSVRAAADLPTLLADHATLELKAAGEAQRLIRKYGAVEARGRAKLPAAFRSRLVNKMSRLAREELRHFEQVVAEIERRGGSYRAVTPSGYAAGLHALARRDEPDALVDALVIGAVIEARSCERFASLLEPLAETDPGLARFYASLLRAEARHFEDYLALAKAVAGDALPARIDLFLARDAELAVAPGDTIRFLSGPPAAIRPSA